MSSATSPHAAVWRQPWQARRGLRGWRRPWVPLLLVALPMMAFVTAWPALAGKWLAVLGLASLAWLWWLEVDGLLRQNRAASARLVPGRSVALRLSLLGQGLVVAAAACAILALAFGPRLQWLWLILPIVVLTAWLQREPWLWCCRWSGRRAC